MAPIDRLLAAVRAQGMAAVALTDHGTLSGTIEFYRAAEKKGIKPILGMEAYVAPGHRRDRRKASDGEHAYHLTLLARNEKGFHNLMQLSTLSWREGYYYHPRVDRELLHRYRDGLIALSGCPAGEFGTRCRAKDWDGAVRVAGELAEIFGKENFFLEIQRHGLADEERVQEGARRAHAALGLPLVATNDTHYVHKEDSSTHDVMLAIKTGAKVADKNRLRFETPEFHIKSPQEMAELFRDCPETLHETVEIARRCNVRLELDVMRLPVFPDAKDCAADELLLQKCLAGMNRRGLADDPRARQRLESELQVIREKGLAGYFLIVHDFVDYARRQGIPVGPGRGSAAGSLISYVLGITDLDPIRYDLLFERFLNPERREMPDIDIDFAPEGRPRILDYLRRRYGPENVAQIGTFNMMKARQAIRDVARVLDVPFKTAGELANRIPQTLDPDFSLAQAVETDAELRALIEANPSHAQVVAYAIRLENSRRHMGIHAAGVVIADRPITDFCPLMTREGTEVTQYDMDSIKALGLLKMDILGLQTLTVLQETLRLVERTTGRKIDLDAIPLDDAETFRLLQEGWLQGVFQMETSRSARDLILKMKPTTFEDLIAAVALQRPGPMQAHMDDMYIDRKHGRKPVTYPHPALEPILRGTYGAILYQEQVMLIAKELAGFSLAKADHLRKAMGKKDPRLMETFEIEFLEGCRKNGVDPAVAKKIWEDMSGFAHYAFNKSHSAAYALISYRTAYLKAHHPREFLSALMTSALDKEEKLAEYIEECRRRGIRILPPDINRSDYGFLPEGDGIRIGLGAVKNVGERAVRAILEARRTVGPFRGFREFLQAVDNPPLDRRALENLIQAGVFDSFGKPRALWWEHLDRLISEAELRRAEEKSGQLDIFASRGTGGDPSDLPAVSEWGTDQLLSREKQALGFYITGNPLARYEKLLARITSTRLGDLRESPPGSEDVLVAGVVSNTRVRLVQSGRNKGARYLTFDLSDSTGRAEVRLFPAEMEQNCRHVVDDRIILLWATPDSKGGSASLIVRELIPLEELNSKIPGMQISFDCRSLPADAEERLCAALQSSPGTIPVRLFFTTVTGRRVVGTLPEDYWVSVTPELIDAVEASVGEGAVRLEPLPAPKNPRMTGTWADLRKS